MGLLDQVIGGVLGNVLGGGRGGDHQQGGGSGGGALGGSLSPIVQALLMLLLQKGGGGLGEILGGGRGTPDESEQGRRGPPEPYDDGDQGGFNQDRDRGGYGGGSRGSSPEGDFSDLSGMLDGPDGQASEDRGPRAEGHSSGAGPYGRVDQEQDADLGGLDGLIDRLQRGGLGDALGSWIGHGQNQAVEPNRLADALGSATVNTLQSRTGLSRDDLLSQLAQALPGVIDGLTPHGRKPEPEERRGW
ncbi:YidB family protein [Methylobacterium sp. E-045]|uniref:YidB family protein n=1 Tax=Methylobacterium sp. E-045 TaxID=2836575 RepID=UPI001FBB66D9|nr:YidB family protein [Methylobacterium sp. E-045]MCJ2128548.1 YidB family protein [Methylobacterium sp. E-045]